MDMEPSIEVLNIIKRFHGHGGPWAALGYRAGLLARIRLKPERVHDIKAEVHLRYEIPYSCFLDGIQIGSGCTVGKRNLSFSDGGDIPVSLFSNKNGQKLKIEIRPEVLERISLPDDSKAVWILEQTDDKLFIIR